ncbi:hypothetical protein N7536_008383 [Penicillium majusculum]|uniref:Uncharacterized protein n=1 Tax=Penicillium solitum TaxID=60172 RepID=A0A1V6R871_9EURO|nr:uncharacterized protein PENSOL_c011G01654 [Penicillium solitum]KAJ5685764.1 hypothetical protein N7536_008383 [Penicillium majusculum]OQD97680.1 hypothetical protein PENSOL_c011G01654 [Penicillium solitum]
MPGKSTLQPAVAFPTYSENDSSRLMEMRLMYHCTAVTCGMATIIEDTREWRIWSMDVPSLAFLGGPSNPLIDLLLATSASHLGSLNPDDPSLRLASSYYLCLGLEKFNNMLLQANEENSPILFISSVLVALSVLHSRQEQRFDAQFSVPTDWFRALQGVGSVASITRAWIQNSRFEPLLLEKKSSLPCGAIGTNFLFAELLSGLDNDSIDRKEIATYELAVGHLGWSYGCYIAGEQKSTVRRKIISFPAVVPARFIELLEARDPRSLAITAYFFGLTVILDEVWWMRGVAKREILGIMTLVPEEWKWAMAWPLLQIGSDFETHE